MRFTTKLLATAERLYKNAAKLSLDPSGVNWNGGMADEEAFDYGFDEGGPKMLDKPKPSAFGKPPVDDKINFNFTSSMPYKDAIIKNSDEASELASTLVGNLMATKFTDAERPIAAMCRRQVKDLATSLVELKDTLNKKSNKPSAFGAYAMVLDDKLDILNGAKINSLLVKHEAFHLLEKNVRNVIFMLETYTNSKENTQNSSLNESGVFA